MGVAIGAVVVVADATGGAVGVGLGATGGSPVLAPLVVPVPLPSDAGSMASAGAVVCDAPGPPFTRASFFLRIAVLMISTRPTTPAATDTLRIAAVM